MRYYLRHVEKESSLRLSAYAKGTLLHELIEHFWSKLGSEEEVAKKTSKKKYSNAEEFAKYAKGLWMRTVIASENSKNPIQWGYNNEKWVINSELSDICTPLYPILLEEGKPIFKEIPFDFLIEGKRFRGRIDYIRIRDEKIVIGDYKSGKPWMGEMKLNNDPQLTFYNIGLCSLCCSDDEIAEKLGLREKRKEFMGKPIYINPDFDEEFFMIEAPAFNLKKNHSINVINSTTRKDEHFFELLNMINGIEKAVSEGEIYPERGRKCDYCDMKYSCEKRLNRVGSGHLEDKTGQGFFSFAIPLYARDQEQLKDKNIGQKRIRYRFNR
jgi:hypothetical protein